MCLINSLKLVKSEATASRQFLILVLVCPLQDDNQDVLRTIPSQPFEKEKSLCTQKARIPSKYFLDRPMLTQHVKFDHLEVRVVRSMASEKIHCQTNEKWRKGRRTTWLRWKGKKRKESDNFNLNKLIFFHNFCCIFHSQQHLFRRIKLLLFPVWFFVTPT